MPDTHYLGAIVPAADDNVLCWTAHGLLPAEGDAAGSLLAADSWLVADGAVRALDEHWARFGGWCGELGVAAGELARFRAAVTASLPRGPGRWFPRVEAVGVDRDRSAELRLRLRPAPAPAPAHDARVALGDPGDPRRQPRRKGPDLERLIELRARAVAAGADELLLCDADGRLLEGALSSLLWWEHDTLWTTPAERTLPGITRALLLDVARRRGVALRTRAPLPEELAGCEAWLTSALHGIRVIGAWGPAPRAPAWQAALGAMARRLDAAAL